MDYPIAFSFADAFAAAYPLQADLWIEHFAAEHVGDRLITRWALRPGREGFKHLELAEDGQTQIMDGLRGELTFASDDMSQLRRFGLRPVFDDGPGRIIQVEVAYYPASLYASAGLNAHPDVVILHCTPNLHFTPPCSGLPESQAMSEVDVAFARDEWGELAQDVSGDYEIAQRLARALSKTLAAHNGIPSDRMMQAMPFDQYRMMKAGVGKGYCENWAVVMVEACRAFGVPARTIWLSQVLDTSRGVVAQYGSSHLTTEIFDRQRNHWIWLDNRFDCMGAYLGEEGPLNLTELCLFLNQPHRRRRLRLAIHPPDTPEPHMCSLDDCKKVNFGCFEEWGLSLDYHRDAHRTHKWHDFDRH